MPRSISHIRRALPYRLSILSRKLRSVDLSEVLPSITSYASGNPVGVITSAITTCLQSGRPSRLYPYLALGFCSASPSTYVLVRSYNNKSNSASNRSFQRCCKCTNNVCLCSNTRSRHRYSRSFSATAKSCPSNTSIALWSNHCRCTRNSLPGSISRFTTNSSSTCAQATLSRPSGNFSAQNRSSCNCRQSSHPNQQLPYGRARSSFISLSFTCTLSIASAGTGRSSGNRLSGVNRFCSSSNTSSVLRQAASWLSLISPRYKTCRCAIFPDCRRRLSTTV